MSQKTWPFLAEHLSKAAAQDEAALLLPTLGRFENWMEVQFRMLKTVKVFQLAPWKCREGGVPTPRPELDRFGGNLPAVVEYLKRNHPTEYALFLETATQVVPSIEDITTGFTHTKTLSLFIKESHFDRPWPAEDVSDGTIQTLGLLVAIFDPRTELAVIEEPENSVHPWAIRNLVQAARTAAEKKQIFFTTHSPILIDRLKPEELWVVQRPRGETEIDPVLKLDPSLASSWGQGKFTLSEYLDSGALPGAVPTFHS
jgi:predicted ATPase